ncbi:hypothetical protein LPJ62_004208 [Coemansia sp. RSA 2167]|nr:hypothetical protein LPJ62_004208 [Coemansia sp. RSA 2167]KAJ2126045.1 hypothetical protein GGF48_003691 [Coemansia sp. RSA 921]KAJ2148629.1 hypothetical protein J3F82_004666 [Coemansia sp. RSA 637]KAJ2535323.1 hypothetical protein IWW43_001726 [Coemansia sp. RSA 1935]KAJ2722784.1 hypothetical protein H4S00_002649 [Coemansia sp. D1744]
MKFLAASALVAAAVAQSPQMTIPSQTLNQAQMEALATLSAAQAQLNAQNSQMIADNRASQEAAILSISGIVHESDLGELDSSHSQSHSGSGSDSMDSMDNGSVDEEDTDSGAASVTASVLAVALAVAVMF